LLNLLSTIRGAVHIRTLPEVLVDHIGLSDPINVEDVLSTISKAIWVPDARGRSLRVECGHPAIDLALHEHINEANLILEFIWQKIQKKQDHLDVLGDLPLRLTGQDIVPEVDGNGSPAYETPHLRFQLSHNEIRELLMGEQLYGSPTLAIRELYQNALDACRYRLTRISYLRQMGRYSGPEWEGHIIFRQGVEEGREFIECEDNGIGMGKGELEDAFSHAGRRFVDMPEFIEEQAEWLRCNPPLRLYPNSQFGVGVFSYFMLADELLVETARLDRDGNPGRTLEVQISGSGSLFRVKMLDKEKDAGSRIRLYLNKNSYKDHYGTLNLISCLNTLNELLLVAQFKTDVVINGTPKKAWNPGIIDDKSIKICPHPDLWWTKGRWSNSGYLLADGIKTDTSLNCTIANLNQAHRPKLTVDRTKVVDWDKEYVIGLLRDNISVLLEDPDWLSYMWLWALESFDPIVAQSIVDGLLLIDEDLSLRLDDNNAIKLPLKEIGCFGSDKLIFEQVEQDSFKRFEKENKTLLDQMNKLKDEVLSLENKVESCSVRDKQNLTKLNKELKSKRECLYNLEVQRAIKSNDVSNKKEYAKRKFDEGYPPLLLRHRFNLLIRNGLNSPDWLKELIDTFSMNEVIPKIHAGDNIALSKNLDGKKPWIEDKVSAMHILMCARKLNESIDKSYMRFQRLSALGFNVPLMDLLQTSGIYADEKDEILLSFNLDGKGPWLESEVSLIHILCASKRLNESVGSILTRLHRFSLLGLIIPEANPILFEDLRIMENDLIPFRKIVNSGSKNNNWIDKNEISAYRVLISAKEMNEPISYLLHRLQYLTPLGLTSPNVDPNEFDNLTINHESHIPM